jgi:hypothetical protein
VTFVLCTSIERAEIYSFLHGRTFFFALFLSLYVDGWSLDVIVLQMVLPTSMVAFSTLSVWALVDLSLWGISFCSCARPIRISVVLLLLVEVILTKVFFRSIIGW